MKTLSKNSRNSHNSTSDTSFNTAGKTNIIKASINYSLNTSSKQKQINEEFTEPPVDYNQLAEACYFNGYHSKCIELKASLTTSNGFYISPKSGLSNTSQNFLEDKLRIEALIANNLFLNNEHFAETLFKFQLDYEIYGNAFLEVLRNLKGEVSGLMYMPAIDTRYSINDNIRYAALQNNGSKILFTPFGIREEGKNEYVTLKCHNSISNIYGVPEYYGAIASIMLDRASTEFNLSKMKNHAVPDSIIFIKGAQLSVDAKSKIKSFLSNNFKGVNNAGRSLILEVEDSNVEIDIKQVSEKIADMSFKNLRHDIKEEILAVHGVPKRILGITESGNLGGTNESLNQMKIFQDSIIALRQKRLEFLLNELILNRGMGIKNAIIKFNELYPNNPQQDAAFYKTMLEHNVLTTDEVRFELGYE